MATPPDSELSWRNSSGAADRRAVSAPHSAVPDWADRRAILGPPRATELSIDLKCGHCARAAGAGRPLLRRLRQPLGAAVPHCRHPLAPDVAFCTGCGQPLPATTGRRRSAGGPASGQRALRRPRRLHPVRRAGRPGAGPRHADRLLRHRPPGRRPVRRGGGEVHRRRGDGAVRRAGGHRDRRAALRPGRAGAATGAGPVRADRPQPRCGFRVGVATGEALVDVAAARDGGQAIVAGDVVNTASRLQSVAPPGGVLVMRHHVRATRDAIRVRRRSRRSPCAAGRRRPRCGWPSAPVRRQPRPASRRRHPDGRPGTRAGPAGQRAAPDAARADPAAGDRVRPGRHRQEPAGPRAVPARRQPARRADDLADRAAARRSARTSPSPRWPTSSRPRPACWTPTPPAAPRERLRRRAAANWSARTSDRLADALGAAGRPARRTSSPAERDRVGLAAVPARPGRPPARPCWSSRTCTGPTRRCSPSSSSSARRRATYRCWCCRTARPELRGPGAEPGPATISGSMTISVPPMRDTDIATLYSHAVRAGDVPAELARAADRVRRRQPALRPGVRPDAASNRARCASAGRTGRWTARRPADAGHRARGHRQPARPAGPADRAVLQAAAVVGVEFWPGAVATALGRPVEWVERALRRLRAARPGVRADRVDDGRRSPSTGSGTCWSATSATSGCPGPSGWPGTSAPPTGWTAHRRPATPTWPRCWPTTAGRPTRSPGRSGWTPRPYAPAGAGRAAPGGPPGVRAARAGHRRRATSAGRWPWPTTAPRPGAWSCSTPRSGVLPGRRRLPRWPAAPDKLTGLAERLTRAATGRGRRGPGRCSPRPPGCGPTARRRCTAWTRRSASTTTCRTARRRRAPCWSWPGCTCSTRRPSRRAPRRGRPPTLAERLQLREVQANARITLAVARYLAGSAEALPSWRR